MQSLASCCYLCKAQQLKMFTFLKDLKTKNMNQRLHVVHKAPKYYLVLDRKSWPNPGPVHESEVSLLPK